MAEELRADEPTRIVARPPLLALAQRALVAVAAYRVATSWCSVGEALDTVRWWIAHRATEVPPLSQIVALALAAVGAAFACAFVARAARLARARPRLPGTPGVVRVDAAGLHVEGRLAVARGDLLGAEVVTDADLGFATVVRTTGGWTVRMPARTEDAARRLAMTLDPSAEPTALVFEGVTSTRRRETARVALATVPVVLLFAAFVMLRRVSDVPTYWSWFKGWEAELPWTFAWWLSLVSQLGSFPAGVALARALAPWAARLAAGRVRVTSSRVETSAATLAMNDLTGVASGGASDVALTLRDGRSVRVGFSSDRALSERELFVRRIREQIGASSGVRVAPAVRVQGAECDVVEPEDVAEREQAATRAPQATRRA